MYLGVTSHQSAPRVASFADAQRALERASTTPTGRARAAKPDGFPLGGHSKSVTWVREIDGGSIAFMLYQTDVVVWAPDNSVHIDNFGTVTTSGFAARFLPAGISLNHTVEKRGASGGNKAIQYRSSTEGCAWGSRRMCQGDVVRFVEDGDVWVPDEDTLDPMTFPVYDTRAMRDLGKRYHLKDFELWLSMAPMHLDLEHEGFDVDDCMAALEKRDFRTAAVHLPTITIPNGWGAAERIKPLPIAVADSNKPITLGSIGKLRLAILDDQGLMAEQRVTTMPVREYRKRMALVRQLEGMGLCGGDYGASS